MEYNDDDDLDVSDDDDYEIDNWVHSHNHFRGYPRLPDKNDRGLSGNHTRSSSSVCQPPLHYYTSSCERHHLPSVKVQAKESVSSLLFTSTSRYHVKCLH